MRTFSTEVECPFGASTFWTLRGDFTVEKTVASHNGRDLSIEWEKHDSDAKGNATLARRVLCRFTEDKVPAALRNFVKQADLAPCVESMWWRDLYDQDHPCITNVCAVSNRIEIKTTSWLNPIDPERCVLCTRTEITCPIFGVGNMVEKLIEKDMQTSQEDYMARLLAHQQGLHPEPPTPIAEARETLLMADRVPPLLLQRFKMQKTRSPFRLLRWGPLYKCKTDSKESRKRRFLSWGCCGTTNHRVSEDDMEHEDIVD